MDPSFGNIPPIPVSSRKSGESHQLKTGEMIIMPDGKPHAFVEGEFFGNGRGWLGQVVPAVTAELIRGNVLELTLWAGKNKLCPTLTIELSVAWICYLAYRLVKQAYKL